MQKIWKIPKVLNFVENLAPEKNVESVDPLLFFFLFSYVSHIFFHPFSIDKDASRSRQALSNAYLDAKIGVDTEENGPFKVWGRQMEIESILFTP